VVGTLRDEVDEIVPDVDCPNRQAAGRTPAVLRLAYKREGPASADEADAIHALLAGVELPVSDGRDARLEIQWSVPVLSNAAEPAPPPVALRELHAPRPWRKNLETSRVRRAKPVAPGTCVKLMRLLQEPAAALLLVIGTTVISVAYAWLRYADSALAAGLLVAAFCAGYALVAACRKRG
jgi:hypothetical protein